MFSSIDTNLLRDKCLGYYKYTYNTTTLERQNIVCIGEHKYYIYERVINSYRMCIAHDLNSLVWLVAAMNSNELCFLFQWKGNEEIKTLCDF